MAQNYINSGKTFEYTVPASTTITAGQPVFMGSNILGVALGGGTTGDVIQVSTCGAWQLPKNTGAGTAIAQGAKAYWDNTAKKVTGVATSNTHIGYGYVASVDGDAFAQIKLGL